MTTRHKWEAGFALLILVALFGLWWYSAKEPVAVPETPTEQGALPANAAPTPSVTPGTPVVSPADVGAISASRIFAERFGSYSSEASFANVDDVKAMATASFAGELERLRSSARASYDRGVYYGVSTRVLNAKVLENTATSAKVELLTQREETIGTASPQVKTQTITVTLVKEGSNWKVSGYSWNE